MHINSPSVIAELMDLHAVYEKALIGNDVAVLDELFWDSPQSIRFGSTENLHGSDEIRAFRQGRPAINLAREITRLDVMTFGDSTGVINLEFVRSIDGEIRHGRQTQFWLRFPEGWRIVSAHVSLLPGTASYLDSASAQIALAVEVRNRGAVNDQLARISSHAQFLMTFPLQQDIEAAPVFQP